MTTTTLAQTKEKHPDTAARWELTKQYAPGIMSDLRIVGSWLWIDLHGAKADSTTAKALELLGYRWNEARALYQHNCGSKRRYRRSSKRYEPRDRYGANQITA